MINLTVNIEEFVPINLVLSDGNNQLKFLNKLYKEKFVFN